MGRIASYILDPSKGSTFDLNSFLASTSLQSVNPGSSVGKELARIFDVDGARKSSRVHIKGRDWELVRGASGFQISSIKRRLS